MAKKQTNIQFPKLLIIALIIVCIGLIFVIFPKKSSQIAQQSYPHPTQNNQIQSHTSQDLKISFDYPKDWDLTDKNFSILLTNYKHNPHSNYHPKTDEIEIQMREYTLCQPTLDQDLVFWGCGEGNQVANKILEKDTRDLQSGTLSKYVILYPQTNTKQTLYYLQKNGKILQISKQPDSTQFEKEFEGIIDSMKLLQ